MFGCCTGYWRLNVQSNRFVFFHILYNFLRLKRYDKLDESIWAAAFPANNKTLTTIQSHDTRSSSRNLNSRLLERVQFWLSSLITSLCPLLNTTENTPTIFPRRCIFTGHNVLQSTQVCQRACRTHLFHQGTGCLGDYNTPMFLLVNLTQRLLSSGINAPLAQRVVG